MLYFVIPIKVKWLGIVYAAFIVYDMTQYIRLIIRRPDHLQVMIIAMIASLLNFVIFFLSTRSFRFSPQEQKGAEVPAGYGKGAASTASRRLFRTRGRGPAPGIAVRFAEEQISQNPEQIPLLFKSHAEITSTAWIIFIRIRQVGEGIKLITTLFLTDSAFGGENKRTKDSLHDVDYRKNEIELIRALAAAAEWMSPV